MSNLYYESDADVTLLKDLSIAVVGYGNQGRSWALNLRDSGFVPRVCVRADESRELAQQEGFEIGELADASQADVVCILIPDDAIPKLPLVRPDTGLTIVASGKFADEWDTEAASGHPKLNALLEEHAGPGLGAFEMEMRKRLGPGVSNRDADHND
jgi:ketol-acid reductoisomerase